ASGLTVARFRKYSHCSAKLVTSVSARSSLSIRLTCCSRTARSLSFPPMARFKSSSSGMLLHRKKDRREASWISVMRYAVFDRITDIQLASRLSFFLWSSIPDDRSEEHTSELQSLRHIECS